MELDRGRLGVIISSLIISTTLISFIAVSSTRETQVEVAEVSVPDQLFVQGAREVIHELVIASKRLKKMEIVFYCLSSEDPIWVNTTPLNSREEIALSILQVKNKIDLCEMLGLNFTTVEDLELEYEGQRYSVDLYDFSILNDLADHLGMNCTRLVAEAIAYNRTSQKPELFLEGEVDLFWEKGNTLERVEIRIDDNSTVFYPQEVTDMFPDYPSIAKDTPRGKIVLEDVAPETRVEAIIEIKGNPLSGIPPGRKVLVGTRVVANGVEESRDFAIVRRGG